MSEGSQEALIALPSDATSPGARGRAAGAPAPADLLPVARVVVDNPLPHLDRPFDYLVPASLDDVALPGVRVRVRFAGKLTDAFLLERVESSEHQGALLFLDRVISPERVLTAEIAALARAVADRYAGTLSDVLRLAIPPRHARAEAGRESAAAGGRRGSGVTVRLGDAAVSSGRAGAEASGSPGAGSARVSGAGASEVESELDADPEISGGLDVETASGADSDSEVSGGVGDARLPGAVACGRDVPGGVDAGSPPGLGVGAEISGDAGSARFSGPGASRAEIGSGRGADSEISGGVASVVLSGAEVAPTPAADTPAVGGLAPLTASGGGAGVFQHSDASTGDASASLSRGASGDIPGMGRVPSPRSTQVGDTTSGGGDAASPSESRVGTQASGQGGSASLPVQTDHEISGHVTAAEAAQGPVRQADGPASDYWGAYSAGLSFLAGLRDGRPVRAVWTALPGGPPTWPGAVADAVRQTVAAGRGVVVVVPDGKDVALVGAALQDTPHVTITADLGPAERYRRWLRVLRGEVTVAVGNRATAFAPVRDLGLAVLWDDGDDLHSERLAPYPHAREVLATRVHAAGAAMLIGGYARTAEGTRLIATGWAKPLTAAREEVRRWAPRVRPAGDDAELGRDQAAKAARLPSVAWRALKAGLERGPVLVQVPRRGYLPALNCQNCRNRARCTNCSGPLALTNGHAAPYCRWCGRIAGDWRCRDCGSPRLRAAVVGARRTAEELGRAFPSTRVTTSGRDGVLASVPGTAALVVATPGAEPVAEGGYAAAALLDGWAMLSRPDLRAAEEALRRWLNAAALVRPGGEVVVLADGQAPVTQALVRWDPVTHAERELRDRAELGFPPVTHVATLTGSPGAIREMLGVAALPEGVEVLGPVPVGRTEEERAVLRAPKSKGAELARVLKGAAGVRSARKAAEVVRVDIDPLDLL